MKVRTSGGLIGEDAVHYLEVVRALTLDALPAGGGGQLERLAERCGYSVADVLTEARRQLVARQGHLPAMEETRREWLALLDARLAA